MYNLGRSCSRSFITLFHESKYDLNKIVEFEPDAFMNFSLRTKHIICPILVGHAYHNLDPIHHI